MTYDLISSFNMPKYKNNNNNKGTKYIYLIYMFNLTGKDILQKLEMMN